MPLSAGARLGPYQVVAPLGAGGMGEVYRARDTRLGRDVAVKVLPAEHAGDPEQRFQQEARAAAALSHPNIVAIYDVGSEDGVAHVVFELLEGETLRAALERGTLTPRRVLEDGLQICHGLAAAHARGIVHRDLKPENVFLTVAGPVKLLDFGLARLGEPRGGSGGVDASRTTTEPGVVLGTRGYMSPEQARGQGADGRSDIFSLGAILYEMLSGRRAFDGETPADTLSAILHHDPPPIAGAAEPIAPGLERVIRQCVEKKAEDRFQSAGDVGLALRALSDVAQGGDRLPRLDRARPGEERPYPGLSAFTEADTNRFFGREEDVQALWEKVRRQKLLAVIGPSGVGKTSFLRAGMIPRRPSGWAALYATPGSSPALALGRGLTAELAGDAPAVAELLDAVTAFTQEGEPDRLVGVLSRRRRRQGEALLVLDQFEELFTLGPWETQDLFAALLGRIVEEADVHVLLSLRDDFLFRCHAHPALSAVYLDLTPLGAPAPPALKRALEEPATQLGVRFEDPSLADEMVSTVASERAALPLLAFAAARLWEERDRERRLLTREAYERIGGVAGALARHAEATLRRIGPEREGVVREILRNLVTAEGTRGARGRGELLSVFGAPDGEPSVRRREGERVLDALIDARLLTEYEGGDDASAPPERRRVELVHESLLTHWPRLDRWRAQDEEGALLRDQLRQAARRGTTGAGPRTCSGPGRPIVSSPSGRSDTRAGSPPWRVSSARRCTRTPRAVGGDDAPLVTGDRSGIVRAGPVSGGEPHLCFGHTSGVSSVSVSPDGRWIASASWTQVGSDNRVGDQTIRLWPLLEGPPLHTLPRAELLAKLRSSTNLRVVPAAGSATGYRVEPGPFPGWAKAAEW